MVADMPKKKPAPRIEHRLAQTKFVRDSLAAFAEAVFAWRTRKGYSRRIVGAHVGCSGGQLANIEKKSAAPSYAVYVMLCREMGAAPLPLFEKGVVQ